MLRYVSEAKELYYGKKINTIEFIGHVWYGIKKNANDEHVVETATKSFLELWLQNNHIPVKGQDIIARAGFERYRNSNSHGLWPWIKKNGNADVIQQGKNNDGETIYNINADFQTILPKVVLGL